jgi:hypothetical protein
LVPIDHSPLDGKWKETHKVKAQTLVPKVLPSRCVHPPPRFARSQSVATLAKRKDRLWIRAPADSYPHGRIDRETQFSRDGTFIAAVSNDQSRALGRENRQGAGTLDGHRERICPPLTAKNRVNRVGTYSAWDLVRARTEAVRSSSTHS